jgi:hypothetical protein
MWIRRPYAIQVKSPESLNVHTPSDDCPPLGVQVRREDRRRVHQGAEGQEIGANPLQGIPRKAAVMSVLEIANGRRLLPILCAALNIDFQTVRRVVLDVPYDGIVTVYVEQIARADLLEIKMESDGIQIKEVGKDEQRD